jgi:hypothetical protein
MTNLLLNHIIPNLNPTQALGGYDEAMERRSTLRIQIPFPATVRSMGASSQSFEEHTVLDNLSACGLYLCLTRFVEPGVKLFIVVRFSMTLTNKVPAPCVSLRGIVQRAEPRSEGTWGLAVAFTRHRFLYAAST